MKKFLIVALFIVSSTSANAQVESRDSLYQLLSASANDTNRVMLLIKIADTFETNNQDSAIYYLEQSRQLSDNLHFRMGAYLYNEKSAIVSFTKGDYNLAMQQSNRALDAARALKDSGLIINMLNNTGIVYQYLGQFDAQLDYSLQALAITEKFNKKDKLPAMHHNVANAYLNINQFRKAIEHCLLSLKFHHEIGGYGYANRLFASLGQGYASLNLTDSALYYYNIAI